MTDISLAMSLLEGIAARNEHGYKEKLELQISAIWKMRQEIEAAESARDVQTAPDLLAALQSLIALLPDPELDPDDVQRGYVVAARLAAAESARDVQTALLADASAQLCAANARLREIDEAEVVAITFMNNAGPAVMFPSKHIKAGYIVAAKELIPRPARWSKQEGV